MRVSETGEVTIPAELRDKYGMKPGAEVDIADRDGELVLTVREPRSRDGDFKTWLNRIEGAAQSDLSTDAILDMTRGRDRQT